MVLLVRPSTHNIRSRHERKQVPDVESAIPLGLCYCRYKLQMPRTRSTVSNSEGFKSLCKSLGRKEVGIHPGTSGLNKQLRVISKHLGFDQVLPLANQPLLHPEIPSSSGVVLTTLSQMPLVIVKEPRDAFIWMNS